MIDGKIHAAIVDYGLGNLFSVKQACEYVGMSAVITSVHLELETADVVILPGVGAFSDAMTALKKLDLISPLQEIGKSQKWLVGICLGMQLLMSESYEFGVHEGLNIIEGSVVPIENLEATSIVDGIPRKLKVPQVGWNQIWHPSDKYLNNHGKDSDWSNTPLWNIADAEYFYFVHSFYVKPARRELTLATTKYGQIEFCSSLQYNKNFACQFHPERSGSQGLKIYENINAMVSANPE
jgi:glutamine amidotransferase